ncbi:MAG TPA: hypothetical protein VFK10_06865, partial [Burkholderiaceae bacterium]|nr:hypothetical protein [Burkholderiaceae bacterium]
MNPISRWAAVAACATASVVQPVRAQAPQPKDATETTRAANLAQRAELPLADKQSFDDATRGHVEAFGDKVVMRADGTRPA